MVAPDVSAPLPPPPPPLSSVKVQTIPPEYDLTAADMNRLTLCMKLASKTDQIKYSPIKQRTSHNLLFVLHTTLRGDMIGPMLFEGTILLVSWFDKRGAETGEKNGQISVQGRRSHTMIISKCWRIIVPLFSQQNLLLSTGRRHFFSTAGVYFTIFCACHRTNGNQYVD